MISKKCNTSIYLHKKMSAIMHVYRVTKFFPSRPTKIRCSPFRDITGKMADVYL